MRAASICFSMPRMSSLQDRIEQQAVHVRNGSAGVLGLEGHGHVRSCENTPCVGLVRDVHKVVDLWRPDLLVLGSDEHGGDTNLQARTGQGERAGLVLVLGRACICQHTAHTRTSCRRLRVTLRMAR